MIVHMILVDAHAQLHKNASGHSDDSVTWKNGICQLDLQFFDTE